MKASDAIARYIELRDSIAQKKKEFEASLSPLQREMEQIEGKFMRVFLQLGTDNMTVRGVGTAFLQSSSSASVADKEVFKNFVLESGLSHLQEVRVAKTAVQAYVEENGEPPPGVTYTTAINVHFQRSRSN